MENENQKINRKKRKKNHRLYALVIMLLTIMAVVLGIMVLFYTQGFEVSGNDYCSTGDIKDAVLENPYEINTLYVLAKYKTGHGKKLACMDQMDVSLKNPWTLKVTVKEKPIVGYVKKGKKYAYFDKEGLAVKISDSLQDGLPSIEGVTIKNVKLYQKLSCDKSKIFEEILMTSKEIKKYELKPDKIVYEKSTINLYIGDICVSLGSKVSSEQIAQIQPILEKLSGKKGTLHLEDYASSGTTITFETEKAKSKKSDEETDESTAENTDGQTDDSGLYTWDGTDMNLYDGTGWYDEAGNYYDSSLYDSSGNYDTSGTYSDSTYDSSTYYDSGYDYSGTEGY